MVNKRRAIWTSVDASDALTDRSEDSLRDPSSGQLVEVEVDRQMPSLPEEILVEIWSCVRYDELRGSYNTNGIPIMFIASWVSGRWREITTRLSFLWRDIHISTKVSSRLIELQLERSRSCVLDITTAPSDGNDLPQGQLGQTRLQENWNAALGHISRWRSFEFIARGTNGRFNASYARTLLPSLLDAHAPSLKRLSIQYSTEGPRFSLFGGGAPVLVHIELGWVSSFPTMALMDLSTLTSLTLLAFATRIPRIIQSHEELRDILDRCPSLTDLTIDGVVTDGSLDEIYPIIRVPSLRSLTIILTKAYFVTYFFRHFSAPGLHSLKLRIDCTYAFKAFVDTLRFAGPSLKYPVLSKLSLHGRPPGKLVLLQLLESLASVDYLECPHGMHGGFMHLLVEKQDNINEVPLPLLRTVHWPYPLIDQGPLLQYFISKRISLGVPIAKLRTRYDRFILRYTASEQEWIRKHVEVELYV